jgi:hypothetical protein
VFLKTISNAMEMLIELSYTIKTESREGQSIFPRSGAPLEEAQ